MKADVRDSAALFALQPLEIAAYLRATGWKDTRYEPRRFSLWLKDDDEILLPLTKELADFSLRMGDALRTLAVVEDRSQLELLSDLSTAQADVVRVRFIEPATSGGQLPIEEYVAAAQLTRDILMAAACSTLNPRAVQPNRRPERAIAYLQNVLTGQSERGSYVQKIISPVPPTLKATQQRLFDSEEPFERKVTRCLADALMAAANTVEQAGVSGNLDQFDQLIPRGLSANLCESVAGLANAAGRTVEFSYTWSRSRPFRGTPPPPVRFNRHSASILAEVGRLLRERVPQADFKLRGPIIRLQRQDGDFNGQVTVLGFINGNARRVRIELDQSDYQRAVEAHRAHQLLFGAGRLISERQGYRLEEPENLQFEDADDSPL